eukprot:SAG31_NODE_5096_length_2747_cov_1.421073_3_plen_150_part_00
MPTPGRGEYQQLSIADEDGSAESRSEPANETQRDAAASGSAVPLREGWIRFVSKVDGRTYYVNTATGRSQYSHPDQPDEPETPDVLEAAGDTREAGYQARQTEALRLLMSLGRLPSRVVRAVQSLATAARHCAANSRGSEAEPPVAAWT